MVQSQKSLVVTWLQHCRHPPRDASLRQSLWIIDDSARRRPTHHRKKLLVKSTNPPRWRWEIDGRCETSVTWATLGYGWSVSVPPSTYQGSDDQRAPTRRSILITTPLVSMDRLAL